MKAFLKSVASQFGYEIRRLPGAAASAFQNYSPWLSTEFQRLYQLAAPRTLVSADRCYVLERMIDQTKRVPGDVVECDVYRGGTARLLAHLLAAQVCSRKLYLFDTFSGMPATDPIRDRHQRGDFSDTSLVSVHSFVGHEKLCVCRPGLIPATFAGLENLTCSFVHIDLDIYTSIMDTLAFMWPRLSPGGVVISDDYGFESCPGARAAVDEFFRDRDAVPPCLPTGQAIITKLPLG